MRTVKWAVLAVGEGDAEVALLGHLQKCYLERHCGVSLKIRQAYGKGARNVVEHAIRFAADRDYDRCLVLVDTDVDYDETVVALAAARPGLVLIPSSPCLEATLLAMHGDQRQRNSEQHKREFERRFSGRVQDERILERHFPRELFEAIRERDELMHRLINTFGVKR